MSRQIVSTNIRFNLAKTPDRMAWEYLQQRDKREHRSYSKAVIAAVNDYFVHIPDQQPQVHGVLAPPCRRRAPPFQDQF